MWVTIDKDSKQSFRQARPCVIVAQLGARRHYALPRLLFEAGFLKCFYTDSYIGNKPWLEAALKLIPKALRPKGVQRWLGRKDAVLPVQKVKSYDFLGMRYVWARYRARTQAQSDFITVQTAKRFNRRIISGGLGKPELVWGFNGIVFELFQEAKKQDALCILEQIILPRRKELHLLREEAQRWPDWEPGLDIPQSDSIVSEREEREWTLADYIIVGSEFVRTGLLECGVPDKKIRVIPYGVDTSRFPIRPRKVSASSRRPLRLLFVGFVGLRKGVPDLLQALQSFKNGEVEARIVGSISLDTQKLERAGGRVKFLGKIPRIDMSRLYHWADVFVLPSIVEGSATVTYEALMSGLPVITTPNAGSIVRDGVDGFIVPIRNPDALADAIAKYCTDPALLERHKKATLKSRKYAGLERYRADINLLMQELLRTK